MAASDPELNWTVLLDAANSAANINHLYVVVRKRPDVVKSWSDDEVALRWSRWMPWRRNTDEAPAELTEFGYRRPRAGGIITDGYPHH